MKFNSCMLVAAFVLVLCLTLNQVSGAIGIGKGCGAGHADGEVWYPTGRCLVCNCYSSNYSVCYSCGVVALGPKEHCYIDYEDRSARYPKCCMKRHFCQGDPQFDVKKYQKNIVIA